MNRVRFVESRDLNAIYDLIKHASNGMTTLPLDETYLSNQLQLALQSLSSKNNPKKDAFYWFVLEDMSSHQLIGLSAIEGSIGNQMPFYSYRLIKQSRYSSDVDKTLHDDLLILVNDHQKKSELCGLFLDKDYRGKNLSILLSKSRFLFMANFKERFEKYVIADMRGVSDDYGKSPFWEGFMSKFFPITFAEADKLTLLTHKRIIQDLMPKNPIYVTLLSKKVQATLGRPHPETMPAYHLLEKEGFHFDGYIDIFDGGPTIECKCETISTIKTSKLYQIASIVDNVYAPNYLISTTTLPFYASIQPVFIQPLKNTLIISKATAHLLNAKLNDTLRMSPI